MSERMSFQVEIGNDDDGWVPFGKERDRFGTAELVAGKAVRIYVNADRIGVRIVRIMERRDVTEVAL